MAELLVVALRLAVGHLVLHRGSGRRRTRRARARRGTSARRARGSPPRGRRPRATGSAPRPSPARVTFFQNSSRSPGILPSACSRPFLSRAMPQCSHMILPSSRWNDVDGALALHRRAAASCGRRRASAARTSGWSAGDRVELLPGQVVADRVRDDEVAVGQALHQRRGPEAVRPVVREVRLAERRTGPGSCSSGCNPPTARPSCSGRRGRCASAPCRGSRR